MCDIKNQHNKGNNDIEKSHHRNDDLCDMNDSFTAAKQTVACEGCQDSADDDRCQAAVPAVCRKCRLQII